MYTPEATELPAMLKGNEDQILATDRTWADEPWGVWIGQSQLA